MKSALPQYRFNVMMGANIIMAVLSLTSFFLVTRELKNRPQAFVRGVYSGTFLKLLVCMASVLLYVLFNKPDIHKPTLFILFGIYAVYSIIETTLLSKIARVK
jgi:hypothetical protein